MDKLIFFILSVFLVSCQQDVDTTPSIIADCEQLAYLPNGETGGQIDVDNVWISEDLSEELVIFDDCVIRQTNLVTGEVCYGNMPGSDCITFILNLCGEVSVIEIRSVTQSELIIFFVSDNKEVVYNRFYV